MFDVDPRRQDLQNAVNIRRLEARGGKLNIRLAKEWPNLIATGLQVAASEALVAKSVKSTAKAEVLPFLKWAGGKRWLMPLAHQLREVPFRSYFEPFLGSGAMFFALAPKSAVLSDVNIDLIEAYRALRENACAVERELIKHHRFHDSDYYYDIRASKPRTPHTRAARFIYLNRTCWNGLYRVNRQGQFNVPKGTKENVLLDSDNFCEIGKRLESVSLRSGDFEKTIEKAGAGDLIFTDPPYTVRHQYNGFVKYNEQLFSWDDQVRLKTALVLAKNRGAKIICTNADHASIRELYEPDFDLFPVDRYSAISGLSTSRGKYAELIITA